CAGRTLRTVACCWRSGSTPCWRGSPISDRSRTGRDHYGTFYGCRSSSTSTPSADQALWHRCRTERTPCEKRGKSVPHKLRGILPGLQDFPAVVGEPEHGGDIRRHVGKAGRRATDEGSPVP